MNGPEQVVADLKLLAASVQDRQAGPAVETRVMEAFRSRPVQPRRSSAVWWVAAAAAMVVAAMVLAGGRRERAPLPLAQAPVPQIVERANVGPPPVTSRSAPRTRAAVARRPAVPPAAAEPESPFVTLPYAPPLSPNDSLDVVRVEMPRSAMVRFGVPVMADRAWEPVRADIAVGQDGMARAIRWVK